MGIVLTVLEPPHHPNSDFTASLPPGIGQLIDVCPRVVSPRFDALLVTTRGLVVRDPGSREFFGVPWSNFSLDDHLHQHSRHAVLSLWLGDKRPVEIAIDRRLALNIACVAPVLKSNPDVKIDDVVVAKAPVAKQVSMDEPVYTPPPATVSSNGHEAPIAVNNGYAAPAPLGNGLDAPAPSGNGYPLPERAPDVLPAPDTFGTLADDQTYYDDPIITDTEASVINLIEPTPAEPSIGIRSFDPSEMPTAPLPVVPEMPDIDLTGPTGPVAEPRGYPAEFQPAVTIGPMGQLQPTLATVSPEPVSSIVNGRSEPRFGPAPVSAPEPASVTIGMTEPESGYVAATEVAAAEHQLSSTGSSKGLVRNAAWVGAAVGLLLVAGLVGTAASGYFSPDEAGTARLLTSESVDLD